MENKRVTITIPIDLWREFKKKCIDAGKPMSSLMTELMQQWINSQKDTTKR